MVKIGFKGTPKKYDILSIEDCEVLGVNRLAHDNYGGSAVYRGYTFIGFCNESPHSLMRELGWSL